MTIGKITLDLKNTKSSFRTNELNIISQYFKNTKDLDVIQALIPVITDWELTLYTTEDFLYNHIYEYSIFLPITIRDFKEFEKHKVLDTNLTDISNYYANFDYINGECIDPKTNKNIYDGNIIPCLIHLVEHIITYYIFDWYAYDEHNFEIED